MHYGSEVGWEDQEDSGFDTVGNGNKEARYEGPVPGEHVYPDYQVHHHYNVVLHCGEESSLVSTSKEDESNKLGLWGHLQNRWSRCLLLCLSKVETRYLCHEKDQN